MSLNRHHPQANGVLPADSNSYSLASLQHQTRVCQRQLNDIRLRCVPDDGFGSHERRGKIGGGGGGGRQHACQLQSLERRVEGHRMRLNELQKQEQQQQQSTDSARLEEMLREQRKIAEDLRAEAEAHQLNTTTAAESMDEQPQPMALLTEHKPQQRVNEIVPKPQQRPDNPGSRSAERSKELLRILTEMYDWLNTTNERIRHQQTLGGDLVSLQLQNDELENILLQMEDRRCLIDSNIEAVRTFLGDNDQESGVVLNLDSEDESEVITKPETKQRRENDKLGRRLCQVTRRWAEVRKKVNEWQHMLDGMLEKMHIFQDTLEDVSIQLSDLEETSRWPPVHDIPPKNLPREVDGTKEFHHHVMTFKSSVDHCNNMANEFQNDDVVLSHRNVSRLEDLNNRWRTLLAVTEERLNSLQDAIRDINQGSQPLLSASLDHPWERAITVNQVPYYINHVSESTQWDHPQMTRILQSLNEYNSVRFSAYRTAMKLRLLQRKLYFDQLTIDKVIETLTTTGTSQTYDTPLGVTDIVRYLMSLFDGFSHNHHANRVNVPLLLDLVLNWLMNVYDNIRTGHIPLLSFKVAIIIMCKASIEDKCSCLFSLVADDKGRVDQCRLGLLLHECIQIPHQLNESSSFGGNNIDPSVKSCFDKVRGVDSIEVGQFIEWMKLEPQSLVWLTVLHRLSAAETAKHQVKCSICKKFPIVGFRYRCLKCFSFDMCQNCFFSGRRSKGHKLTHPMQEYSSATTSGEDMRDFTKTLKNKFRSKQYFEKHPRLGYLPVESLDSEFVQSPPSSSPQHNRSMQTLDMHSRLEMYATRLAEAEQRQMASSTPDSGSEDEHSLIAQYCQSLHGNDHQSHALRSPMQIIMAMDVDQRAELEAMIYDLEEENRVLQAEYDDLKQSHSTYDGSLMTSDGNAAHERCFDADAGREAEMLAEARLLRQHKGRLEGRMRILEEHNQQLEWQLRRLKQLLDQPNADTRILTFPTSLGGSLSRSPSSSPLHSAAVQCRGPPSFSSAVRMNGHRDLVCDDGQFDEVDELTERIKGVPKLCKVSGGSNVSSLFQVAGEVGKAVSSLVNIMTDDEDSEDDEGLQVAPQHSSRQ